MLKAATAKANAVVPEVVPTPYFRPCRLAKLSSNKSQNFPCQETSFFSIASKIYFFSLPVKSGLAISYFINFIETRIRRRAAHFFLTSIYSHKLSPYVLENVLIAYK